MSEVTLAVCLIVKNEEKYLRQALLSIRPVASEIIIVDTGSTDATLSIACEFTDKIYCIPWNNDFSQARNFGLDQANSSWILVLDADEAVNPRSITELIKAIHRTDVEGYLIKIKNYYNTQGIEEVASDTVFRLFRNNPKYRFTGCIHEQICDNIVQINPQAVVEINDQIELIHYGYLNDNLRAKDKVNRNLTLLQAALQLEPANLLNHFHLGVEYFRATAYQKALEHFLLVLNNSDLHRIYTPKLLRYITLCQLELQPPETALAFVNTVWQQTFPDHGDLWFLKGYILNSLNRHAEAFLCTVKCLDLPPQPIHYANVYHGTFKVWLQLGNLAKALGDKQAAFSYYWQALSLNTACLDALAGMVKSLEPAHQPEKALTVLKDKLDMSAQGLQGLLGKLFYQAGAFPLALQAFNGLTETETTAEIKLFKGLCLLRCGSFVEAHQQLKALWKHSHLQFTIANHLCLFAWLNDRLSLARYWLRRTNHSILATLVLEQEFDTETITKESQALLFEIIDQVIGYGKPVKIKTLLASFAKLFGLSENVVFLAETYVKYNLPHAALPLLAQLKQNACQPNQVRVLLSEAYLQLAQNGGDLHDFSLYDRS